MPKQIAPTARLENYKRIEKVGEGTYGVVYKASYIPTKKEVALKKIRLEGEDEGIPSTSLREISILRELSDHPNIVELIDIIMDENKLYLVFEFLFMDLKKYIDDQRKQNTRIDVGLTQSYMFQMLQALDFCHKRRIIHRDLKPQNLLIDQQGIIKIADFGLARAFSYPMRAYTHEVVTMWYRPPEILLGKQRYACGTDMWSLGCIFYEMLTNQPLFAGDSEIDQLFKIFHILGTPNTTIWPELKDLPDWNEKFPHFNGTGIVSQDGFLIMESQSQLIDKMLAYDPDKRIQPIDTLTDPYFKNLDRTIFPGSSAKAVPDYPKHEMRRSALLGQNPPREIQAPKMPKTGLNTHKRF